MTRPAADRVKVEWSGTGTGTMTLGSNVSGFQGFPAALDGHVVSYMIEHTTSTTELEAGYGVYTSSGNTLTRDYRTYPTVGGSAVNFSAGTKHVRLTVVFLDVAPNLATTDPASGDGITAGYRVGDRWLNTTTSTLWFCVDHSAGSPGAVWVQLGAGGGGGAVASVNGETGTVTLDAYDIDTPDTPANYSAVGEPEAAVGAHLAGIDAAIATPTTPANYSPLDATITAHLAAIDDTFSGFSVGADAVPAQVVSDASPYALTAGSQLHTNAEVRSHQASVDFEVPADTAAPRKWLIKAVHDGCIVSVAGNAGSVNAASGGAEQLVNGGVAIVEVDSNPGTAPVVLVRGDIILLPTDVGGAKTYDNEDHGQDFRLTSTTAQTFGAASGYNAGFYCNIFRETAGTIALDGADADYTISGPDVVTVWKIGTALVASGKAGVVILDAA